jgi:hypothetical protein
MKSGGIGNPNSGDKLMRSFATALASCALAFLLCGAAAAQGQRPPPPSPPKPYKAVPVTPARPFADPSFEAFRKELADVAKRKDRAALGKLVVSQGYFWETDDGDKADKKKSSFENFAASIGLNAKDGSGWDTLEAAAQDPTLEEVPERKGVMCSPAVPAFDEKAFEELTKETKTEIDEWGYPASADVEVHADPRPNSPVIDKLGMNLVRVMDSDEASANPNAPPPAMKVVTPSGKVGYVPSDAIMPIAFDQLCYMKDGGGWKITGFIGGD